MCQVCKDTGIDPHVSSCDGLWIEGFCSCSAGLAREKMAFFTDLEPSKDGIIKETIKEQPKVDYNIFPHWKIWRETPRGKEALNAPKDYAVFRAYVAGVRLGRQQKECVSTENKEKSLGGKNMASRVLINQSGFVFQDISSENWRKYTWPDASTVVIHKPQWLAVSKRGHRVLDFENISHYIPFGWIHVSWSVNLGQPNFVM